MSPTRRTFLKSVLIMTGAAVSGPSAFPAVSGEDYPSYKRLHGNGRIKARAESLYALYESCTLCPRDCRVNRINGQTGKCRSTSKVKVSSAFPHFGEEAPLVGKGGSGTIFFSNCSLRCVYCQNYSISLEGEGVEISDERLADSMLRLQNMGCHNINLVTPTHYLPNIVAALARAVSGGLTLPLVYNTSGFEKPDILEHLDGLVDIYLPDAKYMDPEMAAKYSQEAFSYPYYVMQALREMHKQVGDLELDRLGLARRGLMLRHLILPGRAAGSKELLKFVAESLSKTTYINLMRQYRPEYKASDFPEINRRIRGSEYAEVLGWARELGLNRIARM